MEAGGCHTKQDPRCRLWKDTPGTVQQTITRHKIQAGVHKHLCQVDWRSQRQEFSLTVVENGRAKILLDFLIHDDKQLMINQSDTMAVDKLQKKALVPDVAIQATTTLNKRKMSNYNIE